MVIRQGIILQPYTSQQYMESALIQITQITEQSNIHPFYSPLYYIPFLLKIIPTDLLFNSSFHIFSAFFFKFLIVILFFLICKYVVGLSNYESILVYIITLVTRHCYYYFGLLQILRPNPFFIPGFYDFRSFVFPLVGIAIYLITKQKLFFAGILLGLNFILHPKFGIRFFAFISILILLWNIFGKKLSYLDYQRISFRKIVSMLVMFILTVSFPLYNTLFIARDYFRQIIAPRVGSIISPLAWLMKNEPDDWLVYFFNPIKIILFIFFSALTLVLWEFIRRTSSRDKPNSRIVASVMMLGTITSLLFFISGLVFEKWLINWLNPNIALTIILTRFWDLIWVVVTAFGFGVSFLTFRWLKSGINRIGMKWSYNSFIQWVTFVVVILFAGLTLHKIQRNDWVIAQKGTIASSGIIYESDYIQVSEANLVATHKQAFNKALQSLLLNDPESLDKNLVSLEDIYFPVLGKKENQKDYSNPEVWNIRALSKFREGKYSQAFHILKMADNLFKEKKVVWKSGSVNDSIHQVKIRIPLGDYEEICAWINNNLSKNIGIIQPPYLPAFNMLSNHIGFWDSKIDQHSMYMIPNYYPLGLRRLYAVAGKYAIETNPGFTFGDVGPQGREFYLNLSEQDFQQIKNDYPAYEYILTERAHKLSFAAIYKNEIFVLYKID